MTRDDIIRMAREARLAEPYHPMVENGAILSWSASQEALERFAAIVAAHEREACAQACEGLVPTVLINGERWLKDKNGNPDVRLKDLAPELESRWEAEQILKNGSVIENYTVQHRCAAAIRARSEK
jgi:hypothetical protein